MTAATYGGNMDQPRPLPDLQNLINLDACEAVRRIRSGEMAAEQYVSALCRHAEAHKGLNVFTWFDQERAREAARGIDASRTRGKALGLLAGLPLIVKDNIDTMGFPSSGGTAALKG